jgi:hypothetical protein
MEGNMSELVANGAECKNPQSLFTEYNQRYFGGCLPRYKVLPTNDNNRWEERERTIYTNPGKENVSVILLHEMVHAAVGMGHGKKWMDEARRIVGLGAPLQEELKRYDPENVNSPKQLLGVFFEAGLDAPLDWTWPEVRRHLGYTWGITDKNGKAKSRRWSRFLRSARRKWSDGRTIAHA